MRILLTRLANRLRVCDYIPCFVIAIMACLSVWAVIDITFRILDLMNVYGIPANATPGDIWRSMGIW